MRATHAAKWVLFVVRKEKSGLASLISPLLFQSQNNPLGVPEPSSNGSNSVAQWILKLMAFPERKGECGYRTVQKSCRHYDGVTPLPTLRTSDVPLLSNAAPCRPGYFVPMVICGENFRVPLQCALASKADWACPSSPTERKRHGGTAKRAGCRDENRKGNTFQCQMRMPCTP